MAPLIATLVLDEAARAWFDALRQRFFPPDRLVVAAHVTMFHALPAALEPVIAGAMRELAAATDIFPIDVTGIRNLGGGAAFALGAPQAMVLRAALASRCAGALTAQDRQTWRPHITVQNKVPSETAKQTCAALAALAPPPVLAEGLALWRYLGGPWQPLAHFPFAPNTQTQLQ